MSASIENTTVYYKARGLYHGEAVTVLLPEEEVVRLYEQVLASEKDSRSFSDWFLLYYDSLETHQTKKTANVYLRSFLAFTHDKKLSSISLTSRDVEAFFLLHPMRSLSSKRVQYSFVKNFLLFIYQDLEKVLHLLSLAYNPPAVVTPLPATLKEDLATVFRCYSLKTVPEDLQEAFLALLIVYETGLSMRELLALSANDILIDPSSEVFGLLVQGSTNRVIEISRSLYEEMGAFLASSPRHYLFYKEHLKDSAVPLQRSLKKLLEPLLAAKQLQQAFTYRLVRQYVLSVLVSTYAPEEVEDYVGLSRERILDVEDATRLLNHIVRFPSSPRPNKKKE